MSAKKITKKLQSKKEVSSTDIMKLAHAGTKEAVAKLEVMIEKETDEAKKDYLFLALQEAELVYFEPTNDQEEKDFCLAKLINDKEEEWFFQDIEINGLACRADFARLDLAVREKMLREITKGDKEMAKLNRDVAQEMLTMAEDQLAEAKEEMADTEAWVQTAKKMLKTKKYQDLPADFFDNYHFDDEVLDEDDEDCCCCDEECDCENDCGCDCECNCECGEDCECDESCECGGCEGE